MNLSSPARLLLAAAALCGAALCAPAPARAQDLTITVPAVPPGAAAPLVNAAVMGRSGFVYFDVTNTRPNTVLNQLVLESPFFGNISGGVAPPGWTITDLANHGNRMVITFRVATCGQQALATGQTGTFRVDFQPDTQAADYLDTFKTISAGFAGAATPCGALTTRSITSPQIPVTSLAVSGSVARAGGPSPLATNVAFTVTNFSTASKTVTMALPTVTPSAGAVASACSPASLTIASAGSGTFSCGVTLTSAAPAAFYVASNASGTPAPASGTGASVGPIRVAPATATFTLDDVNAAPGQVVRGAYQVTNWTAGAIAVTPPPYAQLALAALAQAPGALDPAAVPALAPGATATFTYSFSVTGLSDAYYSASGAATTSAGTTNVATTQQGVVSGWKATWTPPAVIGGRTATYDFTVSLTNGSGGPVSRIDLVNPNPAWTGMTNVSATGVTYTGTLANGLRYDSAPGLASKATATMSFKFGAIGATGAYPFQIFVYGPGGISIQNFTRTVSVRASVDFDVANLSILSDATGNTLYWTNRSTASGTHDGVVIFRTPAGTAPRRPTDFVDYLATPDPQVVYADRYGSPVSDFEDPTPGAYDYRVCNHDADFVYSNCSTGFWNGAGYLDSAARPSGVAWSHQLGAGVFNAPGLVPGALAGVATMAPAVVSLGAANGQRGVDPFALSNPPSAYTPAAPLGNGVKALFAAETDGDVSAIDLSTGHAAWTATKAGERFVAGVTGALASMLPAAYASDVLFLGSDTGRLLAVDARTGATLWTVAPSASSIGALATYDSSATAWRLYVPTAGAGIFAYDLAASSRTVAPVPLAGWTNPGGTYTLGCVSRDATTLACADASGVVRLLDKATGAVKASAASGVSSPNSLWTDAGGLVAGSGTRLARLTVSGAALAPGPSWAPAGVSLSKPQVLGGFVYVGGSDLKVHKLALATLAEQAASAVLPSPVAGAVLGQPIFDTATSRFLVGSSDGRLWALPQF